MIYMPAYSQLWIISNINKAFSAARLNRVRRNRSPHIGIHTRSSSVSAPANMSPPTPTPYVFLSLPLSIEIQSVHTHEINCSVNQTAYSISGLGLTSSPTASPPHAFWLAKIGNHVLYPGWSWWILPRIYSRGWAVSDLRRGLCCHWLRP